MSIFVWESTDLINWKNERVVKVEDNVAGMVWAPEAIWDEDKGRPKALSVVEYSLSGDLTRTPGQYLVYWASRFVRMTVT